MAEGFLTPVSSYNLSPVRMILTIFSLIKRNNATIARGVEHGWETTKAQFRRGLGKKP